MAYNPFYYQSNFPHGYIPMPNQPHQNSITWVQGIEGAKAYPVGAGNSVLLMDSDKQYMYIKSADSTGMPNLKIYEYTEVTEEKPAPEPSIDLNEYVTKKELEAAIAKVKPKKKKIIEVEDDE